MSKRLPSLNWLRVFEAAARAESFARAAERLAMSPPAVSQQIRALEGHIGQPLFTRAAAGVHLTEPGRALLAAMGEALATMEGAANEIAEANKARLVLGVSLTALAGWLSPRLPAFLDAHPDLTLEVHALLGSPELPPRHAELWIAFGQPPPGTHAQRLFGEALVPVAHPEIAAKVRRVEDLRAHRLIEVMDHRRNWSQILPGDARQMVEVDTTLSALALAAARGGVALARMPATDDLVARFGLVPCVPQEALAGVEFYYLLHAEGATLSPGAAAFKAWVLELT